MRAGSTHIAFPLKMGRDRRMVAASPSAHIRTLIEQLVFTNPGERVNRPDYGGGLNQLIFAPNSIELRATVQFTLLAALQHELGDLIEVSSLDIGVEEETFTLVLSYRILRTDEQVTVSLGGPPS